MFLQGSRTRLSINQAIEIGWEQADCAPFRKRFSDFDDARSVESGGQNVGLSDLIEHHVEPEGDALDWLELNYSNVETHVEGQFAWAVPLPMWRLSPRLCLTAEKFTIADTRRFCFA